MARLAAASGVRPELHLGGAVFTPAGREDDADIRRLLRDNPIGGRYALSLEREPDAFAEPGTCHSHDFIVARDENTGEAIGICERTVRLAHVDGEVCKLPYIGALRIAASHRHRIAILKGGFGAMRLFSERPDELPFALTSIAADNAIAMRLLTRGLPGLPRYHPAGEYSTFVLGTRRGTLPNGVRTATRFDLAAIAALLQTELRTFQFSPFWSVEELLALGKSGLPPERFLVAEENNRIVGCIGVWDQTGFRQSIVRRYPKPVAALRPLINAVTPVLGIPRFPPLGAPLRFAVLSHVAVKDSSACVLQDLVRGALVLAHGLNLGGAIFGCSSIGESRDTVRSAYRAAIEYRTSLFLVHWPDGAARVATLGNALPQPELGFL